MSVLSSLLEKRSAKSNLKNPAQWFTNLFGNMTSTGKNISEQNALENSAVWSCVRILSEDLASLPLIVYKRLNPRGKERAPGHYLYKVLHEKANPEMTAFTLKETLQSHVLTWGNGYAEIEYDNAARVKGLWPLLPDRTEPIRRNNGELWYKTKIPGEGKDKLLPAWRVFHVHGLGYDGLKGYSVIRMHREGIGLNKAAEEFGGRFFGNDSRPGGVLKYDGKLNKEEKKSLQQSWEEAQGGLENKWRVAVLQHGIEWQQIGIPPEDSQYIETRNFQNREIARIYRIPPHMIGDMESGASYSSIEQQSINYVVNTLRPWLVRWEQQIQKDLFVGKSNRNHFAEFLVDGLLRGDIESRYNAYAVGRQWGWLSANDVRELENDNPIGEKGDIYMVPANMLPAEAVGEMPDEEDVPDNLRDIQAKVIEQRARRSAQQRLNEEQKFKPLIKNDMQKVVEREVQNVMRNAKKIFDNEENSKKGDGEQRSVDRWESWLEDYYRDFPEYIQKEMEPIMRQLAQSVATIAKKEVDYDSDITPEIDDFMDDYMEAFLVRYSKSSKGQLKSIVDKANEKDITLMEAVEQKTERWEKSRAGNTAMVESTKVGNAVAKTVFATAGVTKLRWQNTGSDTCPFCEELDGVVVGIEQEFVPVGESLKAEGEDHNMKVYKPAGHPPIHLGCQCQIIPD